MNLRGSPNNTEYTCIHNVHVDVLESVLVCFTQVQKNTQTHTYLCMLLFDVSFEPLERVRRFIVDLATFPEAEKQVLTATLSKVTVIDMKR